jgi:hypothetical protein
MWKARCESRECSQCEENRIMDGRICDPRDRDLSSAGMRLLVTKVLDG